MATNKAARGEALAGDATQLRRPRPHQRHSLPRPCRRLGRVPSRNWQARVTQLHAQIKARAKGEYKAKLEEVGLPTVVFDTPADALLILTKRDHQLQQTTKGVLASETLIHHLVQRNLKKAEQSVELAEQRLAALKTECDGWIRRWGEVKAGVTSLEQQFNRFKEEVDDLTARSSDQVFVRNHLQELRALLKPRIDDAGEVVEGLQDLVNTDYAEKVRANDQGGAPFGNDAGKPVLLQEAAREIDRRVGEDGPEVSTTRLKEFLDPLTDQKAAYANLLMNERGSPTDPGLGLLRFAMARLDEGASLQAQQRLEAATGLRPLVEEAFKLREEWRTSGPARLGDPELFNFFLTVIEQTNLGNGSIPPATDWEKLGKLKDLTLLTLKLT